MNADDGQLGTVIGSSPASLRRAWMQACSEMLA